MIELIEQQLRAIAADSEIPVTFINPMTKVPYVLLRKDFYEQLRLAQYDDGPWTDEEMASLRRTRVNYWTSTNHDAQSRRCRNGTHGTPGGKR